MSSATTLEVFLSCFILRHSLLLDIIDCTKMASQRATGIPLPLLPPTTGVTSVHRCAWLLGIM